MTPNMTFQKWMVVSSIIQKRSLASTSIGSIRLLDDFLVQDSQPDENRMDPESKLANAYAATCSKYPMTAPIPTRCKRALTLSEGFQPPANISGRFPIHRRPRERRLEIG